MTSLSETAVTNGLCRFCGRDYEPELNGPCPATDDCPSHFEEVGREHPDHVALTVTELPASTGGRFDSDLYEIAHADGTVAGVGTADEIRAFVADGIFPADIRLTLAWRVQAA